MPIISTCAGVSARGYGFTTKFSPPLSVDALVVAGGGGGAQNGGGGYGGGGDLLGSLLCQR